MAMLDKVLLVDDDDIVNEINETIIRYANFAEEIVVERTVEGALNWLKQSNLDDKLPALIFLDVNMPERNGWAFLDDYESIPFRKSRPHVVMLTSSIYPKDKSRALACSSVIEFLSKPVSIEMLNNIYSKHFESSPE